MMTHLIAQLFSVSSNTRLALLMQPYQKTNMGPMFQEQQLDVYIHEDG